MNLSDLLSEMPTVIQKGKVEVRARQLITADGCTVSRTCDDLTPEQNAFWALLSKGVQPRPSVAERLPAILSKWEQCRAQKGKRRQLKMEAREAFRQYEAWRMAHQGKHSEESGAVPLSTAIKDHTAR